VIRFSLSITEYIHRFFFQWLFSFYSAAALLAMPSTVIATAKPSVRPSICYVPVLYLDE